MIAAEARIISDNVMNDGDIEETKELNKIYTFIYTKALAGLHHVNISFPEKYINGIFNTLHADGYACSDISLDPVDKTKIMMTVRW